MVTTIVATDGIRGRIPGGLVFQIKFAIKTFRNSFSVFLFDNCFSIEACAPDWTFNPEDKRCYWFSLPQKGRFADMTIYRTAVGTCQAMGAVMAEPRTKSINEFLLPGNTAFR